jgi:hypothetical protein
MTNLKPEEIDEMMRKEVFARYLNISNEKEAAELHNLPKRSKSGFWVAGQLYNNQKELSISDHRHDQPGISATWSHKPGYVFMFLGYRFLFETEHATEPFTGVYYFLLKDRIVECNAPDDTMKSWFALLEPNKIKLQKRAENEGLG